MALLGGQPAGLPTGRELAQLCVEILLPVPHLVLMASNLARSKGRDSKKPTAQARDPSTACWG